MEVLDAISFITSNAGGHEIAQDAGHQGPAAQCRKFVHSPRSPDGPGRQLDADRADVGETAKCERSYDAGPLLKGHIIISSFHLYILHTLITYCVIK